MKTIHRILLAGALMSFLGCKKSSDAPQVEAAFNQQFTLGYPQLAYLPTQASPELTVTIDGITDTRCPPNTNCFVAGNVQVTVSLQGQAGTKQTATMCLGCGTAPSPTDSAVVQVNSRRYVLRLHEVTPVAAAAKSDYRVTLTVKR